jgi:hypothetical protein
MDATEKGRQEERAVQQADECGLFLCQAHFEEASKVPYFERECQLCERDAARADLAAARAVLDTASADTDLRHQAGRVLVAVDRALWLAWQARKEQP